MATPQKALDVAAVVFSGACLIHCMAGPLLLVVGSAFPVVFLPDEAFHRLMLIAVLPLSSAALFLGCSRHKDGAVCAFGVAGLVLLFAGGVFVHDLVGETGERIVTVCGSLLLVSGHVRNYKLCRRHSCRH